MIRTTRVLFCEEEHGTGDVMFPAAGELGTEDFVRAPGTAELRLRARAAGWRRIKGRDYCETCVESMKERREVRR